MKRMVLVFTIFLVSVGGIIFAEEMPTAREKIAGRFYSDLYHTAKKYVTTEDSTVSLYANLLRSNRPAAIEVSNFWRTQADVELKPYLDTQYRKLADGTLSAAEGAASVSEAYKGYYYRHWAEIRQMLLKRLPD